MVEQHPEATFQRVTEIQPETPTLIEGLPGHGLVAAIAVDQITTQLELEHHGNVVSDGFPPVATFEDGLVRDLVRVYAGSESPAMTLQSDLALPQASFDSLSRCVLNDLGVTFDQAIFIAGAPAESEDQIGKVTGVGTTEAMRDDLENAGVTIADHQGLVGGITGALVRQCYHEDVPAILLIVRSHPFLPDPKAARSVIKSALEQLVEFDIDTTELKEEEEALQQELQQIATHYQQMSEEGQPPQHPATGMYQ